MTEQISIRRYLKAGCVVNVTQVRDGNRVHWAERVLGPTPQSVAATVRVCRLKCDVLWEGVEMEENHDTDR